MPRFYFHLHCDLEAPDEEGRGLPDVAAAREFARCNICSIVCDNVRGGHLNLNHSIEVVDDQRQRVFLMRFGDAFTIDLLQAPTPTQP